MPAYFFRSEPGAAELRRLARRESGRVCQRVLMIANLLEGMEHEEAARLAGLSRSAGYRCVRPGRLIPPGHPRSVNLLLSASRGARSETAALRR